MLAQYGAGQTKWDQFEAHLQTRAMTLREVLAAEALLITCTLEEADRFLATQIRFDPAFKGFVEECHAREIPVRILSSGLAPLIERALLRNGVAGVAVQANDVNVQSTGWEIRFRDGSDNGHDKAAEVRKAQARGARTVYTGDGISDYDAALHADLRFAKSGRSLVGYLRSRGLEFVEFSSFTQVGETLFGATAQR